MQTTLIRQFFVLFLAAFLVACSSSSGPEKVVEKYINSMLNADMDGFMDSINISEQEKAQMNMMRGKLEEMFVAAQQEVQAAGGVKSVKAVDVKYSSDKKSATVTVRMTMNNGEVKNEQLNAVNTEQGWKVIP